MNRFVGVCVCVYRLFIVLVAGMKWKVKRGQPCLDLHLCATLTVVVLVRKRRDLVAVSCGDIVIVARLLLLS